MESTMIETERLVLVRPQANHLPAYTAYCASDRSVFVGGPFDAVGAFEKFAIMAGHWTLRGNGRLVLIHRASGNPIGHVGALRLTLEEPPDLTWAIWDGTCEGQGYAYEAATAYLRHALRDPGFDRMLIRIAEHNRRSHRLAERLGARRDPSAPAPSWAPDMVTYDLRLPAN